MIGRVQAYGPTLDNPDPGDTLDRVLRLAAHFGRHEGISFEGLNPTRDSARSRRKKPAGVTPRGSLPLTGQQDPPSQ
jgi:hypothetical protein